MLHVVLESWLNFYCNLLGNWLKETHNRWRGWFLHPMNHMRRQSFCILAVLTHFQNIYLNDTYAQNESIRPSKVQKSYTCMRLFPKLMYFNITFYLVNFREGGCAFNWPNKRLKKNTKCLLKNEKENYCLYKSFKRVGSDHKHS